MLEIHSLDACILVSLICSMSWVIIIVFSKDREIVFIKDESSHLSLTSISISKWELFIFPDPNENFLRLRIEVSLDYFHSVTAKDVVISQIQNKKMDKTPTNPKLWNSN